MQDPRPSLLERDYAVAAGAFSEAELAPLRAAFDRLEAAAEGRDATFDLDDARFVLAPTGEAGAPRLQRVVWCGGREPELLAASRDPRILGWAARILGRVEVEQLINQAHFKRPGDGVEFPLHQDAWNRRTGTEFDDPDGSGGFVQCMLCLDDMGADNGPLVFLPGTHRLGPVALEASAEARAARVAELERAHPPRVVTAGAGSLVFFGPYVFHGSGPNPGPRSRRGLVSGFAVPGCNRRRYPGAGLGVRVSAPPPL